MRLVVTRFAETGRAGIRRKRPGPAPDTAKRGRITAALTALLAQERRWTAAQLAAALGEQGRTLSTRQTRTYLRPRAGWRRTVPSLTQRQVPVRVGRARRHLAG